MTTVYVEAHINVVSPTVFSIPATGDSFFVRKNNLEEQVTPLFVSKKVGLFSPELELMYCEARHYIKHSVQVSKGNPNINNDSIKMCLEHELNFEDDVELMVKGSSLLVNGNLLELKVSARSWDIPIEFAEFDQAETLEAAFAAPKVEVEMKYEIRKD